MAEAALIISSMTGQQGGDALVRAHNGQRKSYSQAEIDILVPATYGIGTLDRDDGVQFFCNGSSFKKIEAPLSGLGWSMTHDGQYTQGVPLVVGTGTRVKLTSNGAGILSSISQVHDGGDAYFDETLDQIVPSANIGDILEYRITAKMKPSTSNVVGVLDFQIEDTPPIVTGENTIVFPDNAEREVHLNTKTFTLQNFIDNNASIYLSAEGGSISLYDFKLLTFRAFVGK